MEKSKKKKILIISLLVVALSGLTAGGVYAYGQKKDSKETSTQTEVRTKKATVTQNISISGTVAYDDEVKYYANEDNKLISKVLVEVGDVVEEGQVIVEYDMEKFYDLQDNLKKAQINLKTLQLDLENLTTKDEIEVLNLESTMESTNIQIKESKNEILSNENQIKQLQAKLNIAENTLKQDKELFDKGYKSASNVKESENAVFEIKNSIEKLNQTNEVLKKSIVSKENTQKINNEKLKLANNKNLDKEISYKLRVKAQEIEKAKLEISGIEKEIKNFQKYTVAEKAGIVTEVKVTNGQTVSIGTELLSTADSNKLIINSEISEYEVNKIKVGDKASITGDGFEKEYTATITKILLVAKTNSDGNVVVPIELSLEEPEETIRNNYSVTIKISKEQNNESTLVPLSAIIRDNSGKSYVNVINTETKEQSKKEIKTGEIVGTDVEVKGLATNEKVVNVSSTKSSKKSSGGLQLPGTGGQGGGQGGAPQGPPPGGN